MHIYPFITQYMIKLKHIIITLPRYTQLQKHLHTREKDKTLKLYHKLKSNTFIFITASHTVRSRPVNG